MRRNERSRGETSASSGQDFFFNGIPIGFQSFLIAGQVGDAREIGHCLAVLFILEGEVAHVEVGEGVGGIFFEFPCKEIFGLGDFAQFQIRQSQEGVGALLSFCFIHGIFQIRDGFIEMLEGEADIAHFEVEGGAVGGVGVFAEPGIMFIGGGEIASFHGVMASIHVPTAAEGGEHEGDDEEPEDEEHDDEAIGGKDFVVFLFGFGLGGGFAGGGALSGSFCHDE